MCFCFRVVLARTSHILTMLASNSKFVRCFGQEVAYVFGILARNSHICSKCWPGIHIF